MLLLELGKVLVIVLLGDDLLGRAARLDGVEVVLVVVRGEVVDGLLDEGVHLGLVLALDGLGLGEVLLVGGDGAVALVLGEDLVALGVVDGARGR